jgi:2,3-bisphosphoglycerate-independent phosphoglycerate mutase
VVLTDNEESPVATIQDGDVVVFFNFRTDRGRELTMALSQQDMPEYQMQKLDLHYLTMTVYDKTFEGVNVIFDENIPEETLGEAVSNAGLGQLRIAETEKYPHVTYFFSGGRETTFSYEYRKMVSSPQVATYDLQPSMSAKEVNEALQEVVQETEPSLIVLNYANPDMVGHTGDFNAVVEALETVDNCLEETVNFLRNRGYGCLITADHGNSDYMVNPDGSPNTAHTKYPVPLFLLTDQKNIQLERGKLADIAPTLLALMNLEQPETMSGQSLLSPVAQ